MRTRGLRLVACGAVVGTTISLASPAIAEDLSSVDPAADVLFYDSWEATQGTEVAGHRNGDLRGFSVRYGEKRIRVALKFRELKRSEPVLMVQGRFRFPDEGQLNYAEAVVTATETNRSGAALLTTRDCSVEHRISYSKNRVRLSFPARCFSSPRWIQFNAWILTMDRKKKPTYFYGDHIFPVLGGDQGAVERYTRRIRHP